MFPFLKFIQNTYLRMYYEFTFRNKLFEKQGGEGKFCEIKFFDGKIPNTAHREKFSPGTNDDARES